MAFITCRDAAFSYEGNLAVKGLNFEINAADYLCVVGENGSGKTTLIKGLLGLKSPSSGSITTGDGLKKSEVGYLPQQTAPQKDFPASVFEVVLSGRLNSRGLKPFYSQNDREIALDNLRRLGVENLKSHCYRELSGGQQQRVLLARALCASKRLIILDEPAAGLDPIAVNDMYSLISSLNKETGIAVVMVSHDIRAAVKYASHILHLKSSQEFYGTAIEYLDSDIGKAFLGGERDV